MLTHIHRVSFAPPPAAAGYDRWSQLRPIVGQLCSFSKLHDCILPHIP
jgi:hypothetical protein